MKMEAFTTFVLLEKSNIIYSFFFFMILKDMFIKKGKFCDISKFAKN